MTNDECPMTKLFILPPIALGDRAVVLPQQVFILRQEALLAVDFHFLALFLGEVAPDVVAEKVGEGVFLRVVLLVGAAAAPALAVFALAVAVLFEILIV